MINMLKSRMAYLKYVRSRIRHSPFIRVILDVLAKIGIEIDPYYLVAEGLFDAYTLDSFRGKGIAPYIRYQLYKELEKTGRMTLYSISERFNLSSIRFKKKLNARLVGQGLCVVLFKKWRFSTRLKKL